MTNDVKAKICQKLEWFCISLLYLDRAPCAVASEDSRFQTVEIQSNTLFR